MKYIFILALIILLAGCGQSANNNKELQNKIDSLEHQLKDAYKPGLGEFMSGIQVHHNKLWFAGENNNWKLADFEVGEIMEAIDDIRHYETDRPEIQKLDMINAPLDSVNAAIKAKDAVAFKSSFLLLTNTCNNCHRTVNFEFNVIKVPDNPPFSNQDFKVRVAR